MSTDTQRKRVLKELEEKLEKTTAAADAYERKHQAASKTIGQLKTGIHSIFSRLGGTSAAVEEMLGNQGVTESNMLQYLEIIEQRTTEILEQYAATQPTAPHRRHVRDRRRHAPRQQDCGAPPLLRHGRGRRGGR